jgi:hypothetical protein
MLVFFLELGSNLKAFNSLKSKNYILLWTEGVLLQVDSDLLS